MWQYLDPIFDFVVEYPLFFSIVGGILAFIYFGIPLFILFVVKQSREIEYQFVDPEQQPLPQYLVRFLMRHKKPLLVLGFEEVFTIQVDVAGTVITMTVMVHDDSRDQVAIYAMHEPQAGNSSMEFVVSLKNGQEINTSNSNQLPGALLRPPHRKVYTFPGERNPVRLYENHLALLTLHASKEEKVPLNREEMLPQFLKGLEEDFTFQVEKGEMRLAGDKYRPTLSGSYAMAWRLLPPFAQIRRWRAHRYSEKQLKHGQRNLNTRPLANFSNDHGYTAEPDITSAKPDDYGSGRHLLSDEKE